MAGTISRAAPSSASCRESRATLNRSSCARDPTNDPSMSNSVRFLSRDVWRAYCRHRDRIS